MFFGKKLDSVNMENISDLIRISAHKAYRDLCRTIKYDDMSKKDRDRVKGLVIKEIVNQICRLFDEEVEFNEWHETICNNLIKIGCSGNRKILHLGQIQKWVNMTLKYLRIMGVDSGFYYDRIVEYVNKTLDDPKNKGREAELLDEVGEIDRYIKGEVPKDYIMTYWDQFTRAIS